MSNRKIADDLEAEYLAIANGIKKPAKIALEPMVRAVEALRALEAIAPAADAIPAGWRMRIDTDAAIVQKEGLGGVVVHADDEGIAASILHALASDLLAQPSDAAATNHVADDRNMVDRAALVTTEATDAIAVPVVFGWVQDNPESPSKPHFILNPNGQGMTHDRIEVYAAPSARAVDALTTGAVAWEYRNQYGDPFLTHKDPAKWHPHDKAGFKDFRALGYVAHPAPSPKAPAPSVEQPLTDPEMNTLVINKARDVGLRVIIDSKMLNDNYTNVTGSFPSLVRFARALLQSAHAAGGQS